MVVRMGIEPMLIANLAFEFIRLVVLPVTLSDSIGSGDES